MPRIIVDISILYKVRRIETNEIPNNLWQRIIPQQNHFPSPIHQLFNRPNANPNYSIFPEIMNYSDFPSLPQYATTQLILKHHEQSVLIEVQE